MIHKLHHAKAGVLILLACIASTLCAQTFMTRESMGLKGPVKVHTIIGSEGDKAHYYFDRSGLLTRYWCEVNPYYGNAQAPLDYIREYDDQGRLIWISETDQRSGVYPTLEIAYHSEGGVESVIEFRHGFGDYEYHSYTKTLFDAQGRKSAIEKGLVDDVVTSSEAFDYDSQGRLICSSSMINDEGYHYSVTTTYHYDASGRLSKTESESSEGLYTTTYRYNDKGLLIQERESSDDDPAMQYVITYKYDAQGRLIEVVRSMEGDEWLDKSYSYDSYGNVLAEFKDPSESEHRYEYYR